MLSKASVIQWRTHERLQMPKISVSLCAGSFHVLQAQVVGLFSREDLETATP